MPVDEGTKKFLRTKIIKYGINPVHSDAAQLLCRQKPTVCTLRIQWMLCPIRPCKSGTARTYTHLIDVRIGPFIFAVSWWNLKPPHPTTSLTRRQAKLNCNCFQTLLGDAAEEPVCIRCRKVNTKKCSARCSGNGSDDLCACLNPAYGQQRLAQPVK